MDPSLFDKIAKGMGLEMNENMAGQANNIWKMLDEMVQNNPDQY